MASPAWQHPTKWWVAGIWIAATLLVGAWNVLLHDHGLVARELLYLGEKALLVVHGRPPRLENLGFVSPPLPYLFILVTQDPLWGAATIGGLLLTAGIVWLRRAQGDPVALRLGLLLAVTPPGLHLLGQSPRAALLTLSLSASFAWLRRYCASGATVHLFLFGLVSSTIFLTAYEAALLVPLLVLPVVGRGKGLREDLAILGTALAPTLFMLAGWAYLNWVFLGNPWAFLEGWHGAVAPEALRPGLGDGVRQAVSFMAGSAVLLAPWLVVAADVARQRQGCWPATLSLLSLPVAWLVVEAALGAPARAEVLPLFWICALLAHGEGDCAACALSRSRVLLRVAVAVALVGSWTMPAAGDAEAMRRLVSGVPLPRPWAAEEALVAELRQEEGTVLLDDARLFPVVYLEGNPRRFVLPYEYEFQSALRTPALFARFVVVDSAGEDQLTRVHPLARHGVVPGFFLRSRHGSLVLYERNTPG